MDVNYTPAETAFRDEVRRFIADHLPATIADKVRRGKRLGRDDYSAWHQALNDRGWLAQGWPAEFGGAAWTPVQRHIFEIESTAACAPRVVPFGVSMLGPVLIRFGTPAQQRHYLPRILSGEDWWCQGYSEPGAGSDLASLRMRAERDGDDYVVNGQKTWTTLGQFANQIFCLVRTADTGKPQQGISFLLIDMESPGVTVRPIVMLDGEHEINEIFFDDVRVPVANRVGPENDGWTCAKFLLNHERTGLAGVGLARHGLYHLKEIAQHQQRDGKPLATDPLFAARVARVEIDLMALEIFCLRVACTVAAGGDPGPTSSMLKIKGTEIRQALTDLLRRAIGPYALPFVPEPFGDDDCEPFGPDYAGVIARNYFNSRKESIYGGSNEIQKNIIAKQILGL